MPAKRTFWVRSYDEESLRAVSVHFTSLCERTQLAPYLGRGKQSFVVGLLVGGSSLYGQKVTIGADRRPIIQLFGLRGLPSQVKLFCSPRLRRRHRHLRLAPHCLLLGHRHRHAAILSLRLLQGNVRKITLMSFWQHHHSFLANNQFSLIYDRRIISLQVVQEYERAVIFRLGRLLDGGSKGPGKLYLLIIQTQTD